MSDIPVKATSNASGPEKKTGPAYSKLMECIKQLQENKGSAEKVEQLSTKMEALVTQLEPTLNGQDKLLKELKGMLDYIHKTKADLAGLTDSDEEAGHISVASEELDAVVQTTEDAANRIMDSADVVQGCLSEMGQDVPEKMQNAINDIYDACNFQDLTGQRIRKVVSTLQYLEEHLKKLTGNSGGASKAKITQADRPDEELMNGPGKLGETPSQDDIDNLFNSLD